MFSGQYDHNIDEKGRVIFPTKLRYSLGEKFLMTKGFDGCIFVHTQEGYAEIQSVLARQKPLDPHTLRLQRWFTSTECGTDTQGRCAIPQTLRNWAKIDEGSAVVLLGAGKRVEIWNRAAWDKYNDELTDEMIQDSAREVGIA